VSRIKLGVFVAAGLAVAVVLAFVVGPEASSEPDGLNRVAIDEGLAGQEEPHDLEDSPLAGYGVEGVDDDRLSTGVAGALGVVATFAVAGGGFLVVRQAQRRHGRASNPRPS
jgi:PDGLE domain